MFNSDSFFNQSNDFDSSDVFSFSLDVSGNNKYKTSYDE